MSVEVKVPQLPESVTDATLVTWHKAEGDAVRRDENLVDLETDKVVLEVPAPTSGVLKTIKIPDGTTVTSGEVLALLEAGQVPEAPAAEPEPDAASGPEEPPEPARATGAVADAAPGPDADKLSPAVRRMVDEHDLDPEQIPGSGKGGRITKSDVNRYLADRREDSAGIEYDESVSAAAGVGVQRSEERVPMTRLRAKIAERLVEAQQTAAMLTTFNEVDLSAVIKLRKEYQDRFVAKHDVKLGFMSFFIKASIEALRAFPAVNASIEGTDILYHDYFDIGIAVSTDRGLMVPVLRDADNLSFADTEEAINDFGSRARKGEIGIEELSGGTFTITNGGIFGSMLSTPILNPPQSGILGMHRIQERPMAIDGEVQIRPMMYLALTYDHRIIDGREAVQFLVTVKDRLEDPSRLLLNV